MNNPFISKITPSSNHLFNSVELLTRNDHDKYLIYEETHKVQNPELYKFLNHKINFIAYKTDSANTIKSMMIYIEHSNELFEKLKIEFGDPSTTFSLSGDINGNSSEQVNYESIAWKQDNYVMMVAFPQNVLNDLKARPLTRIWVKQLDSQK